MKIAVIQPYIFPFIGYFQLIKAVDKFVFYDDVNYIKSGWINRNKILVSGKDLLFTIPIRSISQNRMINKTEISSRQFEIWNKKFLKSLINSYAKAPHYDEVMSIIQIVFNEEQNNISSLAINSVRKACEYLHIGTKFELSSDNYSDTQGMGKTGRLIDICKKNNSTEYLNPIGGREIYKKKEFAEKGIDLKFLVSSQIEYNQSENVFIPNLSIIDVMMFNSVDKIQWMLEEYRLV